MSSREDLLVFFDGDWTRQDAVKTLSAPDVVFAAWKLDGGITVQLWPRNHKQPLNELTEILGARPSGQAFTERHKLPPPSAAGWRVIDALIEDPTTPLTALTNETGLSPKTVRKHLQNMVEDEIIFVVPLLGALADPGELVYHVAIVGNIGMRELRQVLGDALIVGGADKPPLKYLLCRANDLADVTTRTQAVGKIPGVESVRVTLNRELW